MNKVPQKSLTQKSPILEKPGYVVEKYGRDGVIRTLDP